MRALNPAYMPDQAPVAAWQAAQAWQRLDRQAAEQQQCN